MSLLSKLITVRVLRTEGDLEEVLDAVLAEVATLPEGTRKRIMARIQHASIPDDALMLMRKLP